MKLFLLILWVVAGICNFIAGEVSMFTYGVTWLGLILCLLQDYIDSRERDE